MPPFLFNVLQRILGLRIAIAENSLASSTPLDGEACHIYVPLMHGSRLPQRGTIALIHHIARLYLLRVFGSQHVENMYDSGVLV